MDDPALFSITVCFKSQTTSYCLSFLRPYLEISLDK
jgi:hypothetical protein